jgi:aryl-alcohol dehydrogenase-like predicted oxidoreductase
MPGPCEHREIGGIGVEKRKLGSSDLEVSVLGLGCNNFGMKIDLGATREVVDAAIEAGINFFDTADMYGETRSESFLGEVLEGRRESVLLATKFGAMAMVSGGEGWGKRDAVLACAEASLERLRTDYIDLYQVHYPDPNTPIEETLGALGELLDAGKVRAIGCSNFSRAQLEEASALADRSAFVSLQNEWSLLQREVETELAPFCERKGIGFLPYFPLASGVLTGKYRRGEAFGEGTRLATLDFFGHFGSEENLAIVERLDAYAQSKGRSILELALGWLASQPSVASVIAGATRPEQIEANAGAMGWRLSEAERAEVDAIVAPPTA